MYFLNESTSDSRVAQWKHAGPINEPTSYFLPEEALATSFKSYFK